MKNKTMKNQFIRVATIETIAYIEKFFIKQKTEFIYIFV